MNQFVAFLLALLVVACVQEAPKIETLENATNTPGPQDSIQLITEYTHLAAIVGTPSSYENKTVTIQGNFTLSTRASAACAALVTPEPPVVRDTWDSFAMSSWGLTQDTVQLSVVVLGVDSYKFSPGVTLPDRQEGEWMTLTGTVRTGTKAYPCDEDDHYRVVYLEVSKEEAGLE